MFWVVDRTSISTTLFSKAAGLKPHDPEFMTHNLKALLAERGHQIADTQLQRLCECADLGGAVTIWDKDQDISQSSVIVVDEAPNPPQVHALRRALSPNATVLIPYGENPAFDYLKSRLRCRGVIGTQAPEAPHLIWWGGRASKAAKSCLGDLLNAHIVTCVRPNTPQDVTAAFFAKALDIFGISYTIDRDEAFISCDENPDMRSRLLLAAWETDTKPLIWLDPHSATDLTGLDINLEAADFAAVQSSAGLSTGFLYFGRTLAGFDLLKSWHNLCVTYPRLPADYLLDAAWAMVSSQRTLVTKWLSPQRQERNDAPAAAPWPCAFEQHMLTTPAQRQARKAGRTGAPEPHCVVSSRFEGRGPLLLITHAQGPASQTANLVRSAATAFAAKDGGFSSLGVVICQDKQEAAEAIRLTNEGYILYALPGLTLDTNAFLRLSDSCNSDRPTYVLSEPSGQRRTATGIALEATGAKAIFGRAESFNDTGGAFHLAARALKLVS